MAYIPTKMGVANFSGDGTTTVLTIPHGLGTTPSIVMITNLDPLTSSLLARTVTYDATNIVTTFALAPLPGENCVYHWIVYK